MQKYKMDLHVHTPASQCYLEEDSDEQYLRILEKAVEEELGIIAITDHNTIAGYKRLFEIKERLIAEKVALLPFKDKTVEIEQRIKRIDEIINVYSKVWIIAGVEITLNPGIHIVVLASDNEVDDISLLLDEIGYIAEKRGCDSDFLPNADVKTFLNSAYLKNKIIIAPHVDSGKGIYNDLKGMYRAEIFRDPNIHAITCNSLKQLEKIQGMVKNDPNYKREKPWVYINASDAHCVEEIGSKTSYVNLEKKNFESLLRTFVNEPENISDVENQEVEELIQQLVKSQKAIMICDIEPTEYEMAKVLSAILNSDYHSIIIGVNDKMEILGVNITGEKMQQLIADVHGILSLSQNINLGLLTENLGNGRQVYVIFVRGIAKKLCYIKTTGEAFVYDKKIKKATIFEIEQIVKNRLLSELDNFHRNNDATIEEMKSSMLTLQQPIGRYKLAVSIEDNAEYLNQMVEVEPVLPSKYMVKWDEYEYSLGNSTGNIYFARSEKVRLEDAVLRYSCPRIKESDFGEDEKSHMQVIEEQCIIITEQGGAYLIEEFNKDTVAESNEKFIVLYLEEEYKDKYSLYSILAWLKSSAFIWYMTKISRTLELYEPHVFRKIVFPCISAMEKGAEIEKLVKTILDMEQQFLVTVEEQKESADNGKDEDDVNDVINQMVDEHNERVIRISKQIDEIIFNALEVSERQKRIIIEDLEALNVFNYLG